MDGMILKAISGFYYVETAEKLYECKARGAFRKKGIRPCVGDRVRISTAEDGTGTVEEVLPRKNCLVRPPLANLDRLFIVSSVAEPSPNLSIIDKITAVAVSKTIEPVVVFTKSDLGDCTELLECYRQAGITALSYSIEMGEGKEAILALLKGKVSAFTGNTGVGKSSLLNSLFPELAIATGEISRKLGRGRHTTRHSELYPIGGGYVADTPGFSTVDIERYEMVELEKIPYCFPEFAQYLDKCRFTGCSHTVEKGCAVLAALAEGKIVPSGHASYQAMYQEVKAIPKWH